MGYGMALGLYNTPSLIEEVGRSEGRYGNLVRGRLAAAYKVYRTASMFDVEFNSTTVAT